MNTEPALDSLQDLQIALDVGAETSRAIGAADVKAGLVLAMQGVVLTGFVAAAPRQPASDLSRLVVMSGLALAGGAALLLLVALWPRLRPRWPSLSWIAFPGRPDDPDAQSDRPPTAVLAGQAWQQAGALAVIARRKYRWFRAAVLVAVADLLLLLVSVPIASP